MGCVYHQAFHHILSKYYQLFIRLIDLSEYTTSISFVCELPGPITSTDVSAKKLPTHLQQHSAHHEVALSQCIQKFAGQVQCPSMLSSHTVKACYPEIHPGCSIVHQSCWAEHSIHLGRQMHEKLCISCFCPADLPRNILSLPQSDHVKI